MRRLDRQSFPDRRHLDRALSRDASKAPPAVPWAHPGGRRLI
jgi:hypothetical protein